MARIRELAKKTPKFILSNVLGTVVDTAVLWLFSEHVFASYFGEYVVSPVISFECAVFVNFLCSWFFIWKDRVVTGSGKSFFRKYLLYNFSASAVFLVKMGFLLLFEPDCREGVRAQLERMKELCKERNNLYEKQNDLKGQKQKIEKSLER